MNTESLLVAVLSTAIVASLAGFAPSAGAEVRVDRHGDGQAKVRIQHAARGVWSSAGPVDESVLNPQGDLRGDGPPSTLEHAGEGWVAWSGGVDGSLHLVRTRGPGWRQVATLAAGNVAGKPLLLPLTGAPAVLWQEGQGLDARVVLAAPGPDGSHAVLWAWEQAELLAGWSKDGSLNVLLAEADGAGHRELVWASLPAPPFPIDIDSRHLAVVETQDAMLSLHVVGGREARKLGLDLLVAWSPEASSLEGVAIDRQGEVRFVTVERGHGNAGGRSLEAELIRQLR